jgi:inactivated superfamily I helicase
VSAQGEASEDTQRITSQLSRSSLHGVAQRKKYWEKRDYSQAGGAKSIYYCWVLNQASKEDVERLIQRASTMRLSESKELQSKVADKLKNIGAEYEKYMEKH